MWLVKFNTEKFYNWNHKKQLIINYLGKEIKPRFVVIYINRGS